MYYNRLLNDNNSNYSQLSGIAKMDCCRVLLSNGCTLFIYSVACSLTVPGRAPS